MLANLNPLKHGGLVIAGLILGLIVYKVRS